MTIVIRICELSSRRCLRLTVFEINMIYAFSTQMMKKSKLKIAAVEVILESDPENPEYFHCMLSTEI
jgi:hypothetical protein